MTAMMRLEEEIKILLLLQSSNIVLNEVMSY